MLAARLHGPRDLRVEQIPDPGPPGPGQARLRVRCTGICGSDLHSFADARIGDTALAGPLVLGHEFAGVVETVGASATDGNHEPLRPGQRVAVDPAQPCHRCESCEHGHPNLCRRLHFCGNYPDPGSLSEWIVMPSASCFPVPDALDDAAAALLEPLGVALHAVDLGKIRVGSSVAVLGAGPIGLLLVQVARLAGADPVFVSDPLDWRRDASLRWGGIPVAGDRPERWAAIQRQTGGRGVDVAIEAAWGGETVGEAVEMVRLGGRVVVVGIAGDDRMVLKQSTARRKGLTLTMCRRMKHVYPRAIRLAARRAVDLHGLITHRFPLAQAAEALALNAAYREKVVKVVVDH